MASHTNTDNVSGLWVVEEFIYRNDGEDDDDIVLIQRSHPHIYTYSQTHKGEEEGDDLKHKGRKKDSQDPQASQLIYSGKT